MTNSSLGRATRLIPFLILVWALPIAQADEQPHASIHQAVREHVAARLTEAYSEPRISVKELDPRLSLTLCSQPLETYDPPSFNKLGRTSVGVRCPGEKPWSLFVSASVSVDLQVVVAGHPLPRGSILQASDVRLQVVDSDDVRDDYFARPEQVAGLRLRRNLGTGEVIENSMLLVPKAVKYGNLVTLVSRVAGLEVRMKGKAMGQGDVGERVAVQNLSSKRTVEGIILANDLVEVR